MPGVPGKGGPAPKRSSVKAGHRTKAELPDSPRRDEPVTVPPASRDWAPEAKRWYVALSKSGQSEYFEPSDWEFARLLARLLTDQLTKPRPSSEMVKALFAAMNDLGTTEGSRRRMKIEVQRTDAGDEPGELAVLDEYRQLSG